MVVLTMRLRHWHRQITGTIGRHPGCPQSGARYLLRGTLTQAIDFPTGSPQLFCSVTPQKSTALSSSRFLFTTRYTAIPSYQRVVLVLDLVCSVSSGVCGAQVPRLSGLDQTRYIIASCAGEEKREQTQLGNTPIKLYCSP